MNFKNFPPEVKSQIVMHWVIVGAILFLCGGLFITGRNLNKTLKLFSIVAIDGDNSIKIINKPNTGTLARIDTLINSSNLVIQNGNKVLNHETAQLSTLDNQELMLFNSINSLLSESEKTVNSVHDTVKSLNITSQALTENLNSSNQTIQKLNPIMDNLNKTTIDADNLVKDPNIKKFIDESSQTMTHVNGITSNTEKVTAHVEKIVDGKKTFLQKIGGVWGLLWQIGMLSKP